MTDTGVQVFVGPANQLELGDVLTGPANVTLETVSDTRQRLHLTIPSPTQELVDAAAAAEAAAETAATDAGLSKTAAQDAAAQAAIAARAPTTAAVQEAVDLAVPPAAQAALTSDPTIRTAASTAAEEAITNKMVGLNVAASLETFGADEGFAILDADGKKTSIELDTAGKPTTGFAADMATAGNLAASGVNYNEGLSFTDADGLIVPDAQYDGEGYLADEVVDRLRPRLDQRTPFNIPRMIRRLPAATETKLISAHLNAVKHMLGTWIPARFPGTDPITTLGGIDEASVRHPSAAAVAVASSIYTGTYDPVVTGISLADAKASVLRVIKGGALCHVTNTPAGGWGSPAGDTAFRWQDSSWAQMYAAAAYLMAADTDADTKTYVNRMLAAEADNARPEGKYWTRYDGVEMWPGDSKAEELAWQGGAAALASVMQPTDPRKAAWDAKTLDYMLHANARPADVLMQTTVQTVKMDTLPGWNIRQDGIIINHGIIHPDYMCSAAELAWSAGVLWAVAGRKIQASFVHNAEWVYRALSDVRVKGRTIYQPGTWELFYPNGSDWGTARMADKAMADVLAHCLGLDSLTTTPAATWADLHLQRCLDMQNRFTDGHTYLNTDEDAYVGREPWVARNLGLAMLAARLPMTTRYNYDTIGA